MRGGEGRQRSRWNARFNAPAAAQHGTGCLDAVTRLSRCCGPVARVRRAGPSHRATLSTSQGSAGRLHGPQSCTGRACTTRRARLRRRRGSLRVEQGHAVVHLLLGHLNGHGRVRGPLLRHAATAAPLPLPLLQICPAVLQACSPCPPMQ